MSNFDADFRLMKPPWCRLLIHVYLIRVLRVTVRPDSPGGAIQRKGSKVMLPLKFGPLAGRCDFMHTGGKSVTENEVFKTMKLDVASSAVSPF